MQNTARPVLTSTYRFQLNADFTFDDAEAHLDHLVALGISHVFCSPILQAAPGSTHGYDVVDHDSISEEMGGIDAFTQFSRSAHDKGLGIIVDVVPNHMAVPTPLWRNHALWEVLREGPDSDFANWFDVDLSQAKAILMPVLGDKIGDELAAGTIKVEKRVLPGKDGKPAEHTVVAYYDHVFPVRPGTENLPLLELLERQWYRLAHWKVASEELNYRRFFDVDTLAAVRVEDPEVFDATHRLLGELFHEGLIDGFRIDHIDGLANPRHYFEQLQALTGGCFVVAEKILEADEEMPEFFQLAGTTGYEALLHTAGLFHNPANLPRLDELWERISGAGDGFGSSLQAAKVEVIHGMLFTEVNRLTSLVTEICGSDLRLGDHTRRQILHAIQALLASMDRYRAYVEPGREAPESERKVIQEAASRARELLDPDAVASLELVVALACGDPGTTDEGQGAETLPPAGSDQVTLEFPRHHERARELRAEFMIRFAQTCGPVMAKSKEDTAFYRWNRFLAVNEVGSEPTVVGITPDSFHAFCERMSDAHPSGMTTLSTHDTKRSEDVRARISTLLEHPRYWEQTLNALREATAEHRSELVDGAIEMLLWQTLVGTWTLPGTLAGVAPISEVRLEQYLTKAMREAKTFTTWTQVDSDYEKAVIELARAALRSPAVHSILDEFVDTTYDSARAFILGQKLVQLTMPGIPDTYQGCEIVDLSLVDPDNRRPVDYETRARILRSTRAGASHDLDAEKMLVTMSALKVRRDHPDAFRGENARYHAIATTSGQAIAFGRGYLDQELPTAITVATRQPSVLAERDWGDHTLILPEGTYRDVLTWRDFPGGEQPLAEVLSELPVAFLVLQAGI